jgi:hypothetical protein
MPKSRIGLRQGRSMIMKTSTQPCGHRPIWHWRAGGLDPPLRLEIKQWSSQTTLLLQFSIELQHALGQHLDPRRPWRASLAEDLIELGKRTVADSKRECIDATSAQLLHGSPRILGEILLVGHFNTPGAQRQHPSKRRCRGSRTHSVPSDPEWTASPICSRLICGRHSRLQLPNQHRRRISIGRCFKPKFATAIRRKLTLLCHLRRNSLSKRIHVIGRADVHKSSNL